MKNYIRSIACVFSVLTLSLSPCLANINIIDKYDNSAKEPISDALYKSLSLLKYNSCARLTIAPVQLHSNTTGNPWIVHSAQNYVRLPANPIDGPATSVAIALEQGMRIGIDTSGCFSRGKDSQPFHYTVKIELLGTGKDITLGSVQKHGDHAPIPLTTRIPTTT